MNAHDRSLAARAAAIAAIALAVAMLVTVATDEGGPWARRVGMLAALAPAAGALGAALTIRLSAARGELRALAALGVDPARAGMGAAAGGALLGALGPVAALLGGGDLDALFPRPGAARRWIVDADAQGLHEVTRGIHVSARGLLTVSAPERAVEGGLATGAASLALVALLLAAIAGPLWVAAGEGASTWRRALRGSIAVVAAIGSFQLVAAGRAPALILIAAPLLLFIDAGASRYRARSR